MPERDSHIVATILVADLVGSGKFVGVQKDLLFKAYHDQIDNLFKLNNYQSARLKSETAEKHGNEEGEGGCDTEKNARGETADTPEGRIADFRTKIAAEKEATGKEYLSFYHVVATSYEINE